MYEVVGSAPDLMGGEPAQVENTKSNKKMMIMAMVPWLDTRDWQRYEEKNPDPLNWMPCLVVGIDALHQRVSDQAINARSQLETFAVDDNKDWLVRAEEEARLLDEALDRCRGEHRRLSHRLVSALGRLERLETKSRTGARLPDEIKFHERLERLRMAVEDPRGPKAKLAEIEAQIELSLKYVEPAPANALVISAAGASADESAKLQSAEQEVLRFLESQVESLSQLVKVALKDAHDVTLIVESLKEAKGNNKR